jgi:hypothetical protein
VVDSASVVLFKDGPGGPSTSLIRIDKATSTQTVLVGNAGDPTPDGLTLADGGDELFFGGCAAIHSCAIYAIPRAGGSLRQVIQIDPSTLTPGRGAAAGLAVDSSSVYWTDGGIWSTPRTGGVATRLDKGMPPFSPGSGGFADIAVDTEAAYVRFYGDTQGVERIPLDGSAPSIASTTPHYAFNLLTSGGLAYWVRSDGTSADCPSSGDEIMSWSGSGAPTSLVENLYGVSALAVYGSTVLWGSLSHSCNYQAPAGGITRVKLPSTIAFAVAWGLLEPSWFASDGTDLYFVVNGGVGRVPLP